MRERRLHCEWERRLHCEWESDKPSMCGMQKRGSLGTSRGILWGHERGPGGRVIVSGSLDNTVKVWNVKTRALAHPRGAYSEVTSVAMDGSRGERESGQDRQV